jgi:transposase
MDNSLSREATDWREGRRLRAFELKQEGWSQQQIAEALGVSKGAVSQWMKRARDGGGVEALKRRPAPGARPRLSEEQWMKLPELLERGAEAHGFRGEVWTCERVAIVIRREFGVSYHPAHVSRLLKALRQSLQKPQRRANQRDEEAIERWKEKRWPSLKKGPFGGDERHHPREGKLYMIEQERSFKGEDAVRFLKHLMRRIPGKLLVVWDGSPIHRGGAVKDFLASGAASRLQLEQLPFSTLRISTLRKGSGSTSSVWS